MNPIGMIFAYSIFFFIPVLIITGILHFTWKFTELKFFLWVKRIIFWPCFLIFLLGIGFSGFYIAKDIVTKIRLIINKKILSSPSIKKGNILLFLNHFYELYLPP